MRRPDLMLVSADTGPVVREEVAAGTRPCPEYLRLEERHGVRLADWTATAWAGRRPVRGVLQAVQALPPVRGTSAVLSDSEHVGLPLALSLRAVGLRRPHVMLGHHLTGAAKGALLRLARAGGRLDRVLVHSASQRQIVLALGLPPAAVHVVPYGVDTRFWHPVEAAEERTVMATGREHRDYLTLTTACTGLGARVLVTDTSTHSPGAQRHVPEVWPDDVERRRLSFVDLRAAYAQAAVVVVPLVPTDFSAGITSALEAMAMGRAVVVSGTRGLAGVVQDGVDGVVVPPGDTAALRGAVEALLADRDRRRELGAAARRSVLARHSLDGFADCLVDHLAAAAQGGTTP